MAKEEGIAELAQALVAESARVERVREVLRHCHDPRDLRAAVERALADAPAQPVKHDQGAEHRRTASHAPPEDACDCPHCTPATLADLAALRREVLLAVAEAAGSSASRNSFGFPTAFEAALRALARSLGVRL